MECIAPPPSQVPYRVDVSLCAQVPAGQSCTAFCKDTFYPNGTELHCPALNFNASQPVMGEYPNCNSNTTQPTKKKKTNILTRTFLCWFRSSMSFRLLLTTTSSNLSYPATYHNLIKSAFILFCCLLYSPRMCFFF